jgi:hypothetical protein
MKRHMNKQAASDTRKRWGGAVASSLSPHWADLRTQWTRRNDSSTSVTVREHERRLGKAYTLGYCIVLKDWHKQYKAVCQRRNILLAVTAVVSC